MSRRRFLKGAIATGASALVADMGLSRASAVDASVGQAGTGNPASSTYPNIVYLFSDQHRNCSWPGGGTEQIQTPNLESLGTQGAVLTNCISNYPLCSPHRACLLTGRYPQAHTIHMNIQPRHDPLPITEPSIGRALRDAGYTMGYVGKWHLYPGAGTGTLVPAGDHRHGFDDYWRACHNYRYRYDTRTYDDDGLEIVLPDYAPKCQMDMVMGFIEQNASGPFCIFLSWHPPHPPFTEAPTRFEDLYPTDEIQVRPNVPGDQVTSDLLVDHQGYYAHITAQDEEIGRLMDKLDDLGIADNTIVAYSSDHGEMMGSLGYRAKAKPWEESINVPFVIRWPAGIPADQQLDVIFSTVDITPTLLGLAGVPIPSQMQGRDLSDVLKGQRGSEPDSAFIMRVDPGNLADDDKLENWWGVRTLNYTYARMVMEGQVTPWVLYDNPNDPYQMNNLINDPGYSGIQAELDGLLIDWLVRVDTHRFYLPLVGRRIE